MPLRPAMDPKEYLSILARRKWMILFTILFILFGASVYCVVVPEKFKSSTTILVIPQKVPEGYVQTTVSIKIEDRLATIQQQVLSRTRLTAVMDELGLFKSERKRMPVEEIVDGMRKRIEIQVRKTDAFTLSYIHENPQTAMLTTSRLASFFIDENLKSREQQAVGTSEFLDSQLQEVKTRLESAEERVRQYKMKFMGELPQQMQANLQVSSRLQEQLRANSESIRNAEDRKVFLESQLASLESHIREIEKPAPPPVQQVVTQIETENNESPVVVSGPDPAAPYLAEFDAKKAHLEQLSSRYTDRYPEMQRVKREVAQLEGKIAEARRNAVAAPVPAKKEPERKKVPAAISRTVPPAPVAATKERDEARHIKAQIASLANDIPALKNERQEILKNIGLVEGRVAQSPKREQEMIALTRDYDNMKASYEDLLKKKMSADISQNLEKRQKGEQFQILDPANLPEGPFVPDRKKVFAIALIAALVAGFGGAIGLEALNPALSNVEDFRHYFKGLPVLAVIPVIHDREYTRKENIRKGLLFGTAAVFIVSVAGFLLAYGERIRTIVLAGRG